MKSHVNVFLISKTKTMPLQEKALTRKLEVNGKEICNETKINDEIKILFEEVFKCHKEKSFTKIFLTF